MTKYKLEIITLERSNYIKNLLNDFPEKDIHYYPDYLKLFEDFLGTKGIYVFSRGRGKEDAEALEKICRDSRRDWEDLRPH